MKQVDQIKKVSSYYIWIKYLMERSPSSEAKSYLAGEEIPRILWFITVITKARHFSQAKAVYIQYKFAWPIFKTIEIPQWN